MSNEEFGKIKRESAEKEPKYDALLVLGACMEWDAKEKKWIFPTWVPEKIYKPKLVMGDERAEAAKEIHKEAKVVLVTGGPQEHPETGETASRANELSRVISEKGVPKEKIIPMGRGGNTLKNAEDTAAYLEANPDILVNNRIAVLSPRFQYERAKMMFEEHPYFKERGIEVDWILVDDTLADKHPMYREWLEKIYNATDPDDDKNLYDKVVASEEKGIADLEAGGYVPKQ